MKIKNICKYLFLLISTSIFSNPILANDQIEEIVVTSSRASIDLLDHQGNVAILNSEQVQSVAHMHIHELMTRVPGVWISRGSGQESLPSIRSPVLTGAGSCGVILTLEDGIPTRPNGFCNINQLFELPTEFAEQIEIFRGPSNALYGSNALHGMINVLLPNPQNSNFSNASLELGPNDLYRVKASMGLPGESPTTFGVVLADDGGFREDSGYRQTKAFLKKAWSINDGTLTGSFVASDLDQETAGFILGENSYEDPLLNRKNLNPEAYRDASSQRISLHWQSKIGQYELDIRPYVRHSKMVFLQHYLPGKPLEENGHSSFGFLANMRLENEKNSIEFGIDFDASNVYLRETQSGPTTGSAFLVGTIPQGKHYDYDVQGVVGATYIQTEFRPTDKLSVSGGLRAEFVDYEYDNHMLDGNTKDDGTTCGFGGCRFARPGDRSDSFSDFAPKFSMAYSLADNTTLYSNVSRGFRAPQMTELYRLQSGQLITDLKPETLDSMEFGYRSNKSFGFFDASAFIMRKKNSLYRDGDGFNVSGGQSRHVGVELYSEIPLNDYWSLSLNGTYAKHTYDFDKVAYRGETYTSGKYVDTAPKWQGNAAVQYKGQGKIDGELQWQSLGSYYLDAQNLYSYPGHDLINLRMSFKVSNQLSVIAALKNLTDIDYADRADYAFGNYRYFPGRGREFYIRMEFAR